MFAPLPRCPRSSGARARRPRALGRASAPSSGCASRTRGGPRFSFVDGPITANNPMGVHHAWGRDAEGRLPALQGAPRPRPALPERLRLPGALGRGRGREVARAELEARDRGVRPRRVRRPLPRARRRVRRGDHRAVAAARDVDGLGQRLLHVLGHEHRVHLALPQGGPPARLALPGPPLDAVVPALRDVALAARAGRRGELRGARPPVALRALPAAATARARRSSSGRRRPWTLPANVAAAVKPDAEYGLRDGGWRLAETGGEYDRVARGEELVGLEYAGPVRRAAGRRRAIAHRVIPWDEVALDEGTGIVHIAPGAGTEDFELSPRPRAAGARADRRGRPLLSRLRPVRRACRPTRSRSRSSRRCATGACWSRPAGSRTATRSAGAATRRSLFRVVDDWFIGVDEIRGQLLERERHGRVDAAAVQKRMDDWLRNMGDWNISRKRYFGLPLPFYPCACGHLNVIGSRAELEERAVRGLEQLQELHRPVDRRGADPLRVVRRRGASASPRSATPGSTRGSSRSRRSAGQSRRQYIPHGYATGAAEGLTGADLPDHAVLGASGSRPTGSRRCASRSGSGSTRSSSCR